MVAHLTLAYVLLPMALALALVADGSSAQPPDTDPEPPGGAKGEAAVPAIDLAKAMTDRALAQQVALNQSVSKRNLSQIGIAVHNFHDAHKRLPADIADRAGKAVLSWRVALLPYLDQEKLYKEFRLNEPWDSKHNKRLLEKMPAVYRSPRVRVKAKGSTVYQVFTGPQAVFGRGRALTLASIPDGTSNTILAIESSEAVPWTRPGGIPFDRKKPLPDLGKAHGKKPLAVMFDGSPRLLDLEKIQPETLKNAIDPADGNVLGNDWREGAEG